VTSACVDDFPIREAWHGVGVDDPFDVGGGIDRREQAGTPQICGDHLADAAREFAFGRAVAEKVGNGDRHRLDGALVHLQPEHAPAGSIMQAAAIPAAPDRSRRRVSRRVQGEMMWVFLISMRMTPSDEPPIRSLRNDRLHHIKLQAERRSGA